MNGFYWETVERGDGSDGDCERGGNRKMEGDMAHKMCIMDSLKGRGFPLENPYPPGVKCPLVPPKETLHMYGMYTPNNTYTPNKEPYIDHTQ